MSSFYIAAAHKSSGKTSITIGLAAALKRAGNNVQTYKKGPDYIDPIWLAQASAQSCYNLDFNTHSDDELLALYGHYAASADIAMIEGNKGLYDGVDLHGSDSNAAMAKLLSCPVVLTIDTVGITRGIAPLLQGYQMFDKDINIAGVILNKVGNSRHQGKLIAAIEYYTDMTVLGVVGYDRALKIPERHLGLVPANESDIAETVINRLADSITAGVDLDKIMSVATSSKQQIFKPMTEPVNKTKDIKIAVASDAVFGFYYADDLQEFATAGAEIIYFDTLNDTQLPEADGLFIGGGFPETHLEKLSQNQSLMTDIKQAINQGMPAYAECGGLMYLAKSISWQGDKQSMVGVIPGDISMHERPQGRGYVVLEKTPQMPWTSAQSQQIEEIAAHEFHYARLDNLTTDHNFAYNVKRGTGINGISDGLIIHNLIANFTHQRNSKTNPWVEQFVQFIRENKRNAS